jgi:hypothetical protein
MAAVEQSRRAGVPLSRSTSRTILVTALGLSLSSFLAFSYVACVLGYLLFPSLPIAHSALAIFLPGFSLLSWGTFSLGLVESVFWGWYVALVFGPLFNFFVARMDR